MTRTSTSTTIDIARVGLAAGASVAASAAWYTAWGDRLARLDEAYAGDTRPPAWVLPVELARSAAVATAVDVLCRRTEVAVHRPDRGEKTPRLLSSRAIAELLRPRATSSSIVSR